MKRVAIFSLLSIVVPLMLTACGGTGGPSSSIRLTMTDFAFSPNSFTVPANEEISLRMINNGATTHSFLIMQAGHQVQGQFTDADKAYVYWEATPVAPGLTVEATFTSPGEPGKYQVICGIPGHLEAGMVATLNVVQKP